MSSTEILTTLITILAPLTAVSVPHLYEYAEEMNKNKTERWNTLRLAMIGAIFGIAYSSLDSQLWKLQPGEIVASLLGAAIGGAALFAIVSGLRNLCVARG